MENGDENLNYDWFCHKEDSTNLYVDLNGVSEIKMHDKIPLSFILFFHNYSNRKAEKILSNTLLPVVDSTTVLIQTSTFVFENSMNVVISNFFSLSLKQSALNRSARLERMHTHFLISIFPVTVECICIWS